MRKNPKTSLARPEWRRASVGGVHHPHSFHAGRALVQCTRTILLVFPDTGRTFPLYGGDTGRKRRQSRPAGRHYGRGLSKRNGGTGAELAGKRLGTRGQRLDKTDGGRPRASPCGHIGTSFGLQPASGRPRSNFPCLGCWLAELPPISPWSYTPGYSTSNHKEGIS